MVASWAPRWSRYQRDFRETLIYIRSPESDRPAPLFNNLGDHKHPITTISTDAQRYFNQGLTLGFAFNHAKAERSFRYAAKLDPQCTMCWWGVAFMLGPNINATMDAAAVQSRKWMGSVRFDAGARCPGQTSRIDGGEEAFRQGLEARGHHPNRVTHLATRD
jgi:hypothetical protein